MLNKSSVIFKQIAVSLLFITIILLTACNEHKLQTVKIEAQANQIIDILSENGIRSNKIEVGEGERKAFEIYVSGGDDTVRSAIQLMEDHCLAQPEPPEIEGGTVITSMEVERAREQRRRKMDIESQLRKLPGVTCVDVNFVMPQDRALAINPYPSTAAVTINYKTPTFPHTADEIQRQVAASVPALQAENVSVILASKPLRALPDNKIAYNFTRVLLISGIGFATILVFVSIVFVLRKKRQNQTPDDDIEYEDEFDDDMQEPELLGENYVSEENVR